jgi:hypothetical protein
VKIPIPNGGFNPDYLAFSYIFTSMEVTYPGAPSSNTWNFTVTGNMVVVQISTSALAPNDNEQFFFYVMGI